MKKCGTLRVLLSGCRLWPSPVERQDAKGGRGITVLNDLNIRGRVHFRNDVPDLDPWV